MQNSKNISLQFKFGLITLLLIATSVKISYSSNDIEEKRRLFSPLFSILTSKGVDTSFINSIISASQTKYNPKFVKINVTGYLSKTDYSFNYNEASITKSKEFLKSNLAILKKAEIDYDIDKEVITAILYIETRFGKVLGTNYLTSVFLSTALANQPENVELNIAHLRETYDVNSDEYKQLEDKVRKRALKKSNWAIEELVAMYNLEKKLPFDIIDTKGSWAGAIGISQFLPSSYLKWAVDGNGDGKINLFELDDAIFSVANYLKVNGWGNNEKDKRAAVFHYNNSNDYVDAVLTLANKIK